MYICIAYVRTAGGHPESRLVKTVPTLVNLSFSSPISMKEGSAKFQKLCPTLVNLSFSSPISMKEGSAKFQKLCPTQESYFFLIEVTLYMQQHIKISLVTTCRQ